MRIAVIAALPGELKQLVNTGFKRVSTRSKTIKKWTCSRGDDQWIATCAGMGAEAARRAFVEAERDGPLDAVLSVGWAGALDDKHSPGSTYIASAVVDAQTGERFELSTSERNETLVSTAHVVQAAEKHRLATTYLASMVDMEAATIVRLATMRGIPVCCVKGISDEAEDALPDLNPFIANGQLHLSRFLWHVAVRPHTWRPLLRLGHYSSAAAHTLASAILSILTGPRNFAEINRTGNVDWKT